MPRAGAAESRWTDLTAADRAGIEAIYRASFPPEERRSLDAISSDGSRLWIARHGTLLAGFGTIALLDRARGALLQYLAVEPSSRSGGIGTLLLDTIAADLRRDGRVDGVFIEIEDPGHPDATDQMRRRLRFYQKWGADELECLSRYFIADFVTERRLPMVLLWKGLDPSTGGPKGAQTILNDLAEVCYPAVLLVVAEELVCI